MPSRIQRSERINREHGRVNFVTAGGLGGDIRIPIKRDTLIAELMVVVNVSQTGWTVAPTVNDVRKAFKSISLESGDGERLNNVPFMVVYDMARFTEMGSAVTNAYGAGGGAASTSAFAFEIHFEADEATHDALAFFRTNGLSDLTLVLSTADDASGIWSGGAGTTPGAQTFTVTVVADEYPDMLNEEAYGSMRQILRAETTAIEGSTGDKLVKLRGKNGTRFVSIHCFDTSGATPVLSDAILDQIVIQQGSKLKKKTRYSVLKQDNLVKRGFAQAGVVYIDQGDDETAWLDFTDAADVDVTLTVLATAPAHRFIVGQSLFVPNLAQVHTGS